AIIQSGIYTKLYPGNRTPLVRDSLAEAEQEGVEFFDYLGVSSLAEARQIDAVTLRDKAVAYGGFWGTVNDQKFNVGHPFQLFIHNKRQMVPVLLGHTSSEFFSVPQVDSVEEFKKMAHELFGDDADQFLELCDAQSMD